MWKSLEIPRQWKDASSLYRFVVVEADNAEVEARWK